MLIWKKIVYVYLKWNYTVLCDKLLFWICLIGIVVVFRYFGVWCWVYLERCRGEMLVGEQSPAPRVVAGLRKLRPELTPGPVPTPADPTFRISGCY